MIVDFSKMKQYTNAHEEIYLQVNLRDDLVSAMGGRFLEPVKVELLLEKTGRIITGKGCVSTVVLVNCSRCLKELEYPVKGELDLSIASMETRDYSPDDTEVIPLNGDELDIRPYVEEAVLIEIPMQPLCGEDCQGICPGCGVNLNYEKCRCKDDDIDPRWEKLKKLK